METSQFIDAIETLKQGKPVAFPTDTVYGLGVAVEFADSPNAIYELKKREADKPIAWLVGGPEALDTYGVDVPEKARELVAAHWPGALTVIVKASDAVPAAFCAPNGTIGLRMPDNETALRLIRVVGPIAASSANSAGDAAPRVSGELDPDLAASVMVIGDDGSIASGVASAVIDCSQGEATIVRQGAIMEEIDGIVETAAAEDVEETAELVEEQAVDDVEETAELVEEQAANETADEEEAVEEAVEPDEEAAEKAAEEAVDEAVDEGADEEPLEEEIAEEAGEEEAAEEQAEEEPPEGIAEEAAVEEAVADDGVYTVPIKFVSHSKKTVINGKLWTNEKYGCPDKPGIEKPKAVVQIVHGMAEHIERYDEFARYLVGRGFVVCGEDHVGHGLSVKGVEELGHIPMKGGKGIIVGDVHTLHRMVARMFPDVPYVLYGHSMGSFIVRCYIARYGSELTACVLSGTGNVPANLSKMGNTLARFIASIRGETFHSKIIDNMGAGGYGKKIANARTNLDWLSTDESVVDAYIADDKCGFMFSVGGYATLLDMTAEVVTPECAEKVPKALPVLLVAGDGDPVGDMGVGVKAAAKLLSDAGVQTVDCKIYEGMRHEIHNEIGKDQVYDDIASWIEKHV